MAKQAKAAPILDIKIRLSAPISHVGPLVFAVIAAGIISVVSPNPRNHHAFHGIIILAAGPVVGYSIAVFINILRNISVGTHASSKVINELLKASATKEGIFTGIVAFFVAFYVVFYYIALLKLTPLSPSGESIGPPISEPVIYITSFTLGFLSLFSFRYAAFVFMTGALERALAGPKDSEAIAKLRGIVFRGDQLYEPPGNLFTTVGIAATFLGLAAGLIQLDLPSLMSSIATGGDSDSASIEGAAANGIAAVTSGTTSMALRSFIGCMGLALGVSMLGVIIALAAQWLRGHGAGEGTEDLLKRAGHYTLRKPRRNNGASASTAGHGAAPAPQGQSPIVVPVSSVEGSMQPPLQGS